MERESIGTIMLPEKGIKLRYYLLFSPEEGYGLEVEQEDECGIISEKCTPVSADKQFVLALGREVARGIVFPGYLSEIVEDQLD